MNVWITGVGSEERWGVKVSACGSLVWGVKKDGELRYQHVDHWCGE